MDWQKALPSALVVECVPVAQTFIATHALKAIFLKVLPADEYEHIYPYLADGDMGISTLIKILKELSSVNIKAVVLDHLNASFLIRTNDVGIRSLLMQYAGLVAIPLEYDLMLVSGTLRQWRDAVILLAQPNQGKAYLILANQLFVYMEAANYPKDLFEGYARQYDGQLFTMIPRS